LQDLGLTTGDESIGIAISADGLVVGGQARDFNGFWRAFRWTASTGMVDIGTLGGPESAVYAANKDGSVLVGSALTGGTTDSNHAFRWTAKTGMQDLQKLAKMPSGWTSTAALGVSADGTVIASYGLNPKGNWEPFRIVLPLP
jgi:probable HAF family extracellular repeat protein